MRERALTRLFLRFRSHRDGRALARLFDATAPELLRVAAIERAETFEASHEVKSWLYGIMVREAAKLRRLARRRPDPARLAGAGEVEPLDRLARAELSDALERALSRCPPRYREVLVPYLREGRSPNEIALELGRSPGTVRMQVHRGLERLRRLLPAAVGVPTRGWAAMRSEVLGAAGFSPGAFPVLARIPLAMGGLAATVLGLATLAWLARWRHAPLDHDLLGAHPLPVPQAVMVDGRTDALAWEASPERRSTAPIPARPEPVAGLSVTGVVSDAAGNPVAGARVFAGAPHARLHEQTRSGPEGRFALDLGELDAAEIYALSDAHAPSLVQQVRPRDGTPRRVQLTLPDPGARLGVRVVDPTGGPVAGASVIVGRRSQPAISPDGAAARTLREQEQRTAADGRASFSSLARGRLPLVVRAKGLKLFNSAVTLSPGESREIEIRLAPGWSMEGRVVDARGAPIQGALVSALRPGWPHDPSKVSTLTDSAGRYRLEGIEPSPFTARAAKSGLGAVEEELNATVGAPTDWNPVITSRPGIRGRVIDERGRPLVGWHVLVHRPGEPHLWQRAAATGDDGSFTISELPEGSLHLSVRTPQLRDGGPIVLLDDVPEGDDEVVIRVPDAALPTARVEGTLRFRSTGAASHGRIRCQRDGESLGFHAEVDPGTGRFRTEPLRPGPYHLAASGDGLVYEDLRDVSLRRDEVLDLGEILLDDPGFLSVLLRCPDDPPRGSLETRLVQLSSADLPQAWSFEDLLPPRHPLPPGTYEVAVESSHYRSAPQRVRIHSGVEEVVEIELVSGTRITLRFLAEPDAPAIESVELRVQDLAGILADLRYVALASEGDEPALTLDLEPGVYTFTASALDGRRASLGMNWSSRHTKTVFDLTLR